MDEQNDRQTRLETLPFRNIFTISNEVVKVMFLHLSVILFTGGVCLSACWDTPRSRPPRSRPPGADTTGADTPQEQTATVADGTHPTGMHSCHSFVFTSNVCRKQDLFQIDFHRLISMNLFLNLNITKFCNTQERLQDLSEGTPT